MRCLTSSATGGGARDEWSARGFDFEAVITTDVLGVVDGGVDEGFEAPSNLDLVMNIDTASAGWWQNGSFGIYFLGNIGGDPTTRAGDLQAASNLEAPDTFKLYEAWYEHRFAGDRVTLLAGLRDMNAEFYVAEHAAVFIHSSFGIGPEASQVGPSIFPTSALGVRLRVDPLEGMYVQFAAFDGVPGDPDDPYGTEVHLDEGDGVYLIGEAGLYGRADHYWKLALGGWHNTAEITDLAGVPRDSNAGGYLLGETDLLRDAASGRGVGVFAQLGLADGDRNQTGTYVGAGIAWTGPFAARPSDVFGAAVAHARNSDEFRSLNPALSRAETAVEFTYQVPLLSWLTVQPDLQYIIDPGTDDAVEDAVMVGFRLQIAL
ncbi:MAG: carbohydrate porin [Gammaproteobacteria bacterium]